MFLATGTMHSNYLGKPLENSRADTVFCICKIIRYVGSIGRMAMLNAVLKLTNSFCITKFLPRQIRVFPLQDKATISCTKTTSQNVIKGVQVLSPILTGNKNTTDLIKKTFQGRESRAIYFVNSLTHASYLLASDQDLPPCFAPTPALVF